MLHFKSMFILSFFFLITNSCEKLAKTMEHLLSKLKMHTYSQKSPLSFCETPSVPNSQNMIFHVRIWKQKQNKLKTLLEVHVNVKKALNAICWENLKLHQSIFNHNLD